MKLKKLVAFRYTTMTILVLISALLFLVGNFFDFRQPDQGAIDDQQVKAVPFGHRFKMPIEVLNKMSVEIDKGAIFKF